MSALLRRITSNHNGDFYNLNCFNSYSTKTRLKKSERVCNDHDYCCVEIPNKDNKILKYNYGKKSLKALSFISFDKFYYQKCLPLKIILKSRTQKRSKAYTFRLRMVFNLLIWFKKQQTWLFQTRGLYWKPLWKVLRACIRID